MPSSSASPSSSSSPSFSNSPFVPLASPENLLGYIRPSSDLPPSNDASEMYRKILSSLQIIFDCSSPSSSDSAPASCLEPIQCTGSSQFSATSFHSFSPSILLLFSVSFCCSLTNWDGFDDWSASFRNPPDSSIKFVRDISVLHRLIHHFFCIVLDSNLFQSPFSCFSHARLS